jgi:acyl carrier protein
MDLMTMTTQDLVRKLAALLQVAPEALEPSMGPDDIEEWDSLATLDIISFLDDAGAKNITAEEGDGLRTIGNIIVFAKTRGIVSDA